MTESTPGMFTTLRHHDFALMWSGQALSSIGNTMFPIILALLVLDRHSGAEALGAVLAIQALAMAAGTGLAAALGDRWRRTRVMLGSDLVRAVAVAVIALAPLRLNTVVFLLLIVAVGVAEGMFQPAYGAVVPRLLPEDALQGGNSLSALSQYVAMVAGPVLAGAVIAAVGPGPALWVDTGTFAASIGTLILIRESAADEQAEVAADVGAGRGGQVRRGLRDFAEGLREVRLRPWVAASILMATLVMTLSVAPAFVAAPIVAKDRLGGAAAYGAMFTALGVGSIIGALVAGRIRTSRPGLVGVCGIFAIFGSVGSLAVLPLAGVLIFWAIAGVGVTIFSVMWITALQRDIPDRVLGRVMALDWLGSQGLMPLGYALAGLVIGAIGTRPMLIGSAVLVLIAAPLPLLVRGGTTFSSEPVLGEPKPKLSQL
jgi:MFS family permease